MQCIYFSLENSSRYYHPRHRMRQLDECVVSYLQDLTILLEGKKSGLNLARINAAMPRIWTVKEHIFPAPTHSRWLLSIIFYTNLAAWIVLLLRSCYTPLLRIISSRHLPPHDNNMKGKQKIGAIITYASSPTLYHALLLLPFPTTDKKYSYSAAHMNG